MLSPKPLMDLSVAYWKSRAFLSAVELGVFRALGSDGLPLEVLSDLVKVEPRRLKVLVGALVALDLLSYREETGDILMTEISQMFLSPDSPACMEGSFMYAREMFPLWGRLEDRLTLAEPVGLTPSKKDTPAFLQGMHQRALMMARSVMPLLSIAEDAEVLDVAAGAGTWSWLLQKEGKGKAYTLVEQEELCSDMESFIAQCGLKNFQAQAQDYHALEVQSQFSDVLYFGALHQEPPERAEACLSLFFDRLKSGGRLWVLDIFASGEKAEDEFAYLFGLNMLLSTDGSVYDCSDFEAMIQGLGELASFQRHRVPLDLPYYLYEIVKA